MTIQDQINAFKKLVGATVKEVQCDRYHGGGAPFKIFIVTSCGTFTISSDCNQFQDSWLRLME